MHIAVKCHSFTVLRSEAYKRHCAGRHEKAGGAKKHSRETYSSEASPQGAFWCFVRLWCVRGVGRGIFLLPGIKKASRGGEPVFSMAEGDQQTPSALLTKKSSPPGTIFFDCRKTLRVFRPFICFPVFPRAPAPRIPPACPCKCSASPGPPQKPPRSIAAAAWHRPRKRPGWTCSAARAPNWPTCPSEITMGTSTIRCRLR